MFGQVLLKAAQSTPRPSPQRQDKTAKPLKRSVSIPVNTDSPKQKRPRKQEIPRKKPAAAAGSAAQLTSTPTSSKQPKNR